MFFLLLVKKLRPPPPFLTTSVSSDKDFFGLSKTPPPLNEKNGQKTQFLVKNGKKKLTQFLVKNGQTNLGFGLGLQNYCVSHFCYGAQQELSHSEELPSARAYLPPPHLNRITF